MTVAAEMSPVGEAADQKIKVAVRVRPLNKRELELRTKTVVKMNGNQTILDHPVDENKPKPFAFDYSFDSSDQNESQFASQEKVFNEIGYDLMENSFAGYNACLFAYGQTSSGKSYSMMGTSDQPGIIPRLCNEIFKRIDQTTSESLTYKVEVSYMEIYNERVRDLLDPKKSNKTLKVREHKILGPIVDGLSNLAVDSYQQIESLIGEGNKSRTVAATNMNAESSRSHAVFNITLTQTLRDIENGFSGEKVSKISLVDLAGSERVAKTGAMGKRLEEGGSINKSLTTLGMVISALAERSNSTKKDKFIPYRDSVLTWLLRDNLGGNSRTVMIATVSPAADNYEETLSTLRYADRAKKIINHAVVNEDPNARIIRELREEVESLRMQISQTKKEQTETLELRERLAESERLVAQMNKSWEERLRETETLNKERQRDLSEIGISVESSGIKVEKDKFYLVNLNADPSLNELLVYYVNGTAIVGNTEEIDASRDSGLGSVEELHLKASSNGDGEKTNIVLRGLGVVHRHAKLSVVSEDGGKTKRLYIEPLTQEGRVFVNGRQISERTLLRNGFRLLFGVHHFFKVNCPKEATDGNAMEESCMYDYKDAWDEVNGEGAGGISAAVDQLMQRVSIKHEEDKKAALEQQYEAFEQYIQNLQAGGFTPSTPMTPCWSLATPLGTPASALPPPFPFAGGSGGGSSRQTVKSKFFYWAQKKKEMLAESLKRLKADLIRAHAMTNEANMISKELAVNDKRVTTYDVTLHIPAANLRPSKIKAGAFICEPVIVVRRVGMSGAQLWSLSQLENKLIDMRELYDDRMNEAAEKGMPRGCGGAVERSEQEADEESPSVVIDPFFESQEQHSLIGVANVFLEVLLHDLRLDYQVPIISQQGEVAGRLHVQIYRVAGPIESEDDRAVGCENLIGKVINCRVRIKRVCDLPESLSHFVFCQYSFFNATEMLVVAPSHDLSHPQPSNHTVVIFEHQRDFPVVVTEEFLEYVQEDALSIEVWGHRSCGSEQKDAARKLDAEERNKSLQARWGEVSRRLELWMQINELNENGKWEPVECRQFEDVSTGGVYQLRQGQQRRICVGVNLPFSEGLPLHIDSIHSVAIGCIWPRKPNVHKTLDSYQEEDLEVIRSQWTGALQTRQKYLEQQLDKLSSCSAKSESDKEREHSLMAQWIALTEERAAVAIPAPNSKIPGSPCDWTPPLGTEKHVPVVFLDLNPDDMAGEASASEVTLRTAGQHSILPLETNGQFIMLPPLQFDEKRCCVICPWDSSVHDNDSLNVVTPSNERIYAILKTTVRLSHPCVMDVVLRKRICMQVYKKSSFAERIFKRMIGTETAYHTSVLYDLVAHVPKSSCDIEERESLAMLAAKHAMGSENEVEAEDEQAEGQTNGQTTANPQLSYIEAYTNSIQAVESMLKLDRLRQEVAITTMLSRKERQERLQHFGLPPHSLKMKRTVSLPNAISNSTTPLPSSSNCGYDSPMGTSTTTSMTPSCRPPRPTFLSLAHSTSNSSRLTSLMSPANERLSGIDEESKETYPVRSSTVPDALSKNAKDLSNEQMDLRNGNLLLSSSSSKISPLGDCTSSASGCAGSGALGAMRWANKPPQGLDLNV